VSRLLFWVSSLVVGWTYVAFPIVLLVRAILRPRPHVEAAVTPRVSVVIAARDEEQAIGAKLENLLATTYPAECREVVVASDGSTDATADVVRSFADRGVTLRELETVGKAAALEAAVAAATGEVLVFTDANSMFAPDALSRLVRPFADPEVGGVAGNQVYEPGEGDRAAGEGERRYWNLDRALKVAESRAGNVISATGAIYAVRRSLFDGVPVGVTDDFAVSTNVIARGRRLVFAPDAIAYEPVAVDDRREYRRKVRIITRGLNGVIVRRSLLDPRNHGFYAVQLLTHKLLRRVMVWPLAVLAAASVGAWRRGPIYRLAAVAQVAFYGAGAVALLAPASALGGLRPARVAGFFVLVNIAAANACVNVLRGRTIASWQPDRGPSIQPSAADRAHSPRSKETPFVKVVHASADAPSSP
jgi:glycosyltransferase involved in cell wall biosynthesis